MSPRPPMPPSGMVTIWADGERAVTAILMDDPDAEIAAGSYEDLERFGDSPIGRYTGRELDSMALDLRIVAGTTTRGNRRVEDDLASLVALARPEKGNDRPGGVWVIGEVPFPSNQLLRIDGKIKLGKRRYFTPTGSVRTLRYQQLSVSFVELETASSAANATPKRSRDSKGKRRTRTIRTRYGDTVRTVAVAELGNGARWTEIRGWNLKTLAKTDPDARLRAGTKLVIK